MNKNEFKITCESIDDDFNNLPLSVEANLNPETSYRGWVINSSAPGGAQNGTNCLTNSSIGHKGLAIMKFNFTLTTDGYISLYFKVSSESGCDFIKIYVDGILKISDSGERPWTYFNLPLLEGDHVLEIHYTKDGSAVNGSDMAFVDEIIFSGLLPPFAKKYLVLSEGEYFKYDNESGLWVLVGTEISPEIYIEHGMDEQPQAFILKELNSPTICYWMDVESSLAKNKLEKIKVEAIPKPILFIQNGEFTLSKIYQTGIKNCLIEKELSGSPILKFAFSTDSGETWKGFNINDKTWNEFELTLETMLEQGVPYGVVEALSEEEWLTLLGDSTRFKIAFVCGITSLTDTFRIREIRFNYTTTV